MTTQTDFAALVVRIDAATDRLETDVLALDAMIQDAEGAVSAELVELSKSARKSAKDAADSAELSALQATEAKRSASDAGNSQLQARIQVQEAGKQVTLAAAETAKATQEANRAKGIADTLLTTAPFDEAPKDGATYGRNNGDWVVVEAGEDALVLSVNGKTPDGQGNISLTLPTKTSELANDSGYITLAQVPPAPVVPAQKTKLSEFVNDAGYITLAQVPAVKVPTKTSELANDSGYITLAEVPKAPTPVITTDAPADGKQYARQDNGWSEVVAPEGGGSGGGSAVVNFRYSTPLQVGYDPQSVKVCFNYALFKAISTKGPYFWNDPDTIDAVNTDEHWMTEAVVNPLGTNAAEEALDIRYFRVYDLNPANGNPKGHSGAVWDGATWQPGNAFLGVVGQIVGEYSGGGVEPGAIMNFLPCGKWFYPKEVQSFTYGNERALPTEQINVNHCMLTKTYMPYGGSEDYPWGIYNNLELIWLTAGRVPSKGRYFYQLHTGTWVNLGSLY